MAIRDVRRSGLTMPVVTPRFVDNAWRRGCDFITLDLEDSVPQHLKAYARGLVKDAIPKVSKGGAEVYTRINHDYVQADLTAVVWPGLSAVRYPKTQTAEEVRLLDTIISRLESERGIRAGTIEIATGIETAVGVANAFEIAAASARVRGFGGASGYDMSRDLGVEMFVDFDQFVYGKGEVELAARTLGLAVVRTVPFVANTTGSVSDPERALRETEAAYKCGFRLGAGGLNPAVVEPHNRGFTPSEEDVRDARWAVDQYHRLAGTGETWKQVEGRVVDRYEAARARDTLRWAALCDERNQEKAEAVTRAKAAMADQAAQPQQ